MPCRLPQGLLRKLVGRCEVMESLPLAPLALPSPGVRPLDLQPLHVCRAPRPDLGDRQCRRQRDEVREGPAGQVCPRVMGRMGAVGEEAEWSSGATGPHPGPIAFSLLRTPGQAHTARLALLSAVRIPGLLSFCGSTDPVHLSWGLFLPKSD